MIKSIKNELKKYFLSPIGYIFIGTFLLVSSFLFYMYIIQYGSIEYTSLFYYTSELLTIIVAFLTMGMFDKKRENKLKKGEKTSQKDIINNVFGKFIAAELIVIISGILSLIYYVILCLFAGKIINITETIATLVGFNLIAMSYISFGMFISSMIRNRIVSGIVTVAILFITWAMPAISDAFYMASPIALFQKYPEGIIGGYETITLIMQIILFILLTTIVVKKRKIKTNIKEEKK